MENPCWIKIINARNLTWSLWKYWRRRNAVTRYAGKTNCNVVGWKWLINWLIKENKRNTSKHIRIQWLIVTKVELNNPRLGIRYKAVHGVEYQDGPTYKRKRNRLVLSMASRDRGRGACRTTTADRIIGHHRISHHTQWAPPTRSERDGKTPNKNRNFTNKLSWSTRISEWRIRIDVIYDTGMEFEDTDA